MPALNTQPCKGCGAKQVCVATFKITCAQPPESEATLADKLVFVSACVFQRAMDLLPPDTSQVSEQQRAAERR